MPSHCHRIALLIAVAINLRFYRDIVGLLNKGLLIRFINLRFNQSKT